MRNTVACVPRLLYFLVLIFAFEYTTFILACSLIYYKRNLLIKNKRRKLKIQNQCCNCFLHIKSFLQLVATLHGCSSAICDKNKQSAEGAIQAVIEFVTKRGRELVENDVSRFSYLKISLVSKNFRILEVCISSLDRKSTRLNSSHRR